MVFEGLKFVVVPDGFDDEEMQLVIDQVTRNGGQVSKRSLYIFLFSLSYILTP
jgi:hypothetical protein